MAKFVTAAGKFPCHRCKEIVKEVRLYKDTLDLTWMCSSKHLSKVNLNKRGY
jgi:hypothetical protein